MEEDEQLDNIQAYELTQSIINALPVPIFVKDSDGVYVYCNRPFEAFVGRRIHEIVGRSVFDLWNPDLARVYHEADVELFRAGGQQQYEAQVKGADGSLRDVIFHKAVFRSAGERYMAGAILDISARKHAERELEKVALTDTLTGAASRYHLNGVLDKACKMVVRQGHLMAIMSLDLDGFKPINDSFGHHAGDELLVQVTALLRNSVRETDTVARLGGDEFALVFEGLTHRDDASDLAKNLLDRLAETAFHVFGQTVRLGASIGISFCPDHGRTPEQLLKWADFALYDAKRAGKGCYRMAPDSPKIL